MKRYFGLILLILALVLFSLCLQRINDPVIPVSSVMTPEKRIPGAVVLDAGHGGEDGGAVAKDGTQEKDVNLVIAKDVAAFFRLFGVPYVMTRDGDHDLADKELDTIRERKRSDILARYALVNETPGSVLLSIHQNMYEVEKYWGAQVFYAPDDADSLRLATLLRASVTRGTQPENGREVKPSNDGIYLLYRAKRPSVMVECGFLSNERELSLLKSPNYDSALAYFICRGVLDYYSLRENV
ncbi:MAG: N-acetylmuramoyl-L-alanine amidase [Clostridia bacterium]|nr:N-acetylmuramoyl-L-alanine amidase [Clostridia bacterium]